MTAFPIVQTIAFVEDDAALRTATVQRLELEGFAVTPFDAADHALPAIDRDFAGIVISDIRLPRMDGLDFFARVRAIDPEIPVNIYDLGLIYGVDVTPDGHAAITMTLTTPHCPVAESMPGEVELRVGAVPGVGHAEVNLVWDPPWDPQKMSDEAKLELGML